GEGVEWGSGRGNGRGYTSARRARSKREQPGRTGQAVRPAAPGPVRAQAIASDAVRPTARGRALPPGRQGWSVRTDDPERVQAAFDELALYESFDRREVDRGVEPCCSVPVGCGTAPRALWPGAAARPQANLQRLIGRRDLSGLPCGGEWVCALGLD